MCFTLNLICQVGIGVAPNPVDSSSILEVSSTKKGLLIPRMTLSQRNSILSPAHSLMIYQTDSNPGYYFNSGTPPVPNWTPLSSSGTQSNYKIPITTLPYTITEPGSYILASNLSGKSGIIISSSDVSIDLNFSTLSGEAGNTTNGILAIGGINRITIYNGTVRNWSLSGISLGNSSYTQIFNINAIENGEDGIEAGNFALIQNCTSGENGFNGISGGGGSSIIECVANANGVNGISTTGSQGSAVSKCISSQNTLNGIDINQSSYAVENVVQGNGNNGIKAGNGSVVNGNQSLNNGTNGYLLENNATATSNIAKGNISHGFNASSRVILTSNTAQANGSNGFHIDNQDEGKLDGNMSLSNTGKGYFVNGTSWLIIKNIAKGNSSSNYDMGLSNTSAVILTTTDIITNSGNITTYANISE